MSGLIRLNLSTKEIANVRNVASHSVRIARSSLRKRLGLEKEEMLPMGRLAKLDFLKIIDRLILYHATRQMNMSL